MLSKITRSLLVVGVVALLATSAAAQETPECEPGFRLFTHELLWSETAEGVCIPENPQRIAYSWVFHTPALLRGGAPLIGIADHAYLTAEFPEWQEVFEAIPDIQLPANLELTLQATPDLIIEPSWAAGDNYDELSAIAPTVAFQFDGTHQWKQLAEMYFELAGIPDAYDALMAEYEARAAELGELIGNPGDIKISLVAVWGPHRLYTNYSPGGMIVEDVGFDRPESQVYTQTPAEIIADGGWPFFIPLDMELIPKADGDFIIGFGDFQTEEGAALLAELQANPLWNTLKAVREGNVYFTSVNWAGGDIAAAHAILDDLAAAFGVADQLSPNPYKTALAPIPTTEAAS